MRAVLRGLRRATASVRVRVALITAFTFAVVLVGGSMLLLNAFEDRLTNRVRADTESAVAMQARQIILGRSDALGGGDSFRVAGSEDRVFASGGVLVTAYRTAMAPVVGHPPDWVDGGSVAGPTEQGSAGGAVATTADAVGVAGDAATSISIERLDAAAADPASLPFDVQTASQLGIFDGDPKMLATVAVNDRVSLAAVSSLGAVQETIDSARTLLWWVVPGLVLLVGGLAWIVVGRALRPVHAVTRQLASISSDSLHERVPVPGAADEVGELAHTMNSMLDRLESATLVSRQLVSDASHELRTPIAVLRTELEVARRDPGTDWQAVSVGMLGEVERLQGLVDDLLLLARANERGMRHEDVDVVDVVAQVAARRRPVPVIVDVEAAAAVSLEGDPVALLSAVDHLVANAARHATTEVHVRVHDLGDWLEIRVEDDGGGIAPEDRERVLERFVRLDEGRARDVGGSGLGLAVANDVAAAHGGMVTIADSTLGGAQVTITIPTRAIRPLALAARVGPIPAR
jgi:signal transduction histidine kinase